MWDFWTGLFDSSGFPARWSCGKWSPGLGWMHIISDIAIWAAYFAIPSVLAYYAYRRKDLPFRAVLLLFVVFIVACGLTHLMDATIFWWPAYRLAGVLKLLTAAASWATVFALVRVTPQLMALRSPGELEREIVERQRAEHDLRALHDQLEQRVAERTAELKGAVAALKTEVEVRSRADALLKESERLYRAIGESIDYGVWVCDREGRNTYASPSFLKLVGLTQEQCSDAGWGDVLHPAEVEGTIAAWQECVRVRGRWDREHHFRGVDGQYHPVLALGVPVEDEAGNLLCFAGISLDIGRLKQAEEVIKASLREKEVLLKEIHHRVKNNLQIVSALLELQSRQTKDVAAVEMFRESRGRVKSMALIHERLYRAQDLARVDFAEYTRQLAGDLFRTYKVSGNIRLELEVDIPSLPIDIAIPCGLLLNELISNCLKHAFAATAEGCIWVTLRPDATANVLSVADDGPGFPAGFDIRNDTSFGLQLVSTLVEQLAGECALTPGRGSRITVRFPKPTSRSEPGTLP